MNRLTQEQKFKQLFANCRAISEFERLDKLGEGTYGTVYAAKDKKTNLTVAIKKVKIHDQNEGFPITCLREIKILQKLAAHPNIVNMLEVAVGAMKDSIHLVFEYCSIDMATLVDRMFVENITFRETEIKCIILQMLNGLAYIHQNFILHRDIKLSNLLLTNQGVLKIADFGLAREFEIPQKNYTNPVVTLWYRAPELLCQMGSYSTSVDVWSVGCVFGELFNKGIPLMQVLINFFNFLNFFQIIKGKSDMNQLQFICEMVGYPSIDVWPELHKSGNKTILKELEKYQNCKPSIAKVLQNASLQAIDLITRMLQWDPEKRIGVTQSMIHQYFYCIPRASMPEEISVLRQLEAFKRKPIERLDKKVRIK